MVFNARVKGNIRWKVTQNRLSILFYLNIDDSNKKQRKTALQCKNWIAWSETKIIMMLHKLLTSLNFDLLLQAGVRSLKKIDFLRLRANRKFRLRLLLRPRKTENSSSGSFTAFYGSFTAPENWKLRLLLRTITSKKTQVELWLRRALTKTQQNLSSCSLEKSFNSISQSFDIWNALNKRWCDC